MIRRIAILLPSTYWLIIQSSKFGSKAWQSSLHVLYHFVYSQFFLATFSNLGSSQIGGALKLNFIRFSWGISKLGQFCIVVMRFASIRSRRVEKYLVCLSTRFQGYAILHLMHHHVVIDIRVNSWTQWKFSSGVRPFDVLFALVILHTMWIISF